MKEFWKQYPMNIQFFAEEINTTGTDTLSAEMKTFYDKELIDRAEPQLVHDQFGQERDIPKGNGKTVEFRSYASLPKATTPLTEGVTPKGEKLTVTAITATVDQYGDFVEYSDMLDLTAIDNNVVEATRLLGSQAGRTLDTITREVLAGGKNVLYVPKRADGAETAVTSRADLTAECLLTVKDVFRAAAILKANNAPTFADGSYVAIIHPYVAHDLMMEAGEAWMDIQKYKNPENIYNGEIGKLGKVRFVETTEARFFDNGEGAGEGMAVAATIFLGADAYGKTAITGGGLQTIVKQLGSAGSADPLNQRATVGWKATKCAERLVEEYMLRVESGTSWNAQLVTD